jgi:predicted ester cyclase
MSVEENKVSVRRFSEEVFNKKNLAAIDDFYAPNLIDHSLPPQGPGGIEGERQGIAMFLTAFPDLRLTVEDIIVEGDKIVVRMTFRGTHQGAFVGIPPTGKQVTVTEIAILRIANGKVIEQWINTDELGLMQQLGAIPTPGQAS